jgi:hypothetical protein
MAALAERVFDLLHGSPHALDDDEIATALGADRHHVTAVCRKLEEEGHLSRGRTVGAKIVNRATGTFGGEGLPRAASVGHGTFPNTPGVVTSGQAFEAHARALLSAHWDVPLVSRVVTVRSGVTHSFDLVSPDGKIVGDAKWYKDLAPIPAAKLSVVAEYVWLLSLLEGVERRFLVFGRDRAVPERWLRRFSPLLDGVEFYFLDDDDLIKLA